MSRVDVAATRDISDKEWNASNLEAVGDIFDRLTESDPLTDKWLRAVGDGLEHLLAIEMERLETALGSLSTPQMDNSSSEPQTPAHDEPIASGDSSMTTGTVHVRYFEAPYRFVT